MPPTAAAPDNGLDRRIAIMDAYDAGRFIGAKTADEIAREIGGTARNISVALKALGFRVSDERRSRWVPVKRGGDTRVVTTARKWRRPYRWPAQAELERKLRRDGKSLADTKRYAKMTELQAEMQMQREAELDPELAEVLRESPDMPRKALLNRTAGILRAATRKGRLPETELPQEYKDSVREWGNSVRERAERERAERERERKWAEEDAEFARKFAAAGGTG